MTVDAGEAFISDISDTGEVSNFFGLLLVSINDTGDVWHEWHELTNKMLTFESISNINKIHNMKVVSSKN
jgi:hypothetical protein